MPNKVSNKINDAKVYYYVKSTATLWGGHIYDVKIGTAGKNETSIFQKIRAFFTRCKYEFFDTFEDAKKRAQAVRSSTEHKREIRYSKEVNEKLMSLFLSWFAEKTGKSLAKVNEPKKELKLSEEFIKYKKEYSYNFYHVYEWDPKKKDSETIRKAEEESVSKAKLGRQAHLWLRKELVKDYLEEYSLSKDDEDARKLFIGRHESFLSQTNKDNIRQNGLKKFLEEAPITARSLPPSLPSTFSDQDKKIWDEAAKFVEDHHKPEIDNLQWDFLKKDRKEELIMERFKNPPSAYNLLKIYAESNPKWNFYTV